MKKILYGIIYKATCLQNNKIYIGKTTGLLKNREYRHYNDAESNRLDTHFARAIRKYGKNNFIFEEIDRAYSEKELDKKEKYWISFYDSKNKGYNETDGGDGGNTYQSKNEIEMNGIKEKIRETKLRDKNPNSVKIKAKNIETNEELFFNTMIECQKYFNEPQHSFCSKRCREITTYMYLGKWMFAYQDKEYNPKYHNKKYFERSKQVKVTNLQTNEVKIYLTHTEAGKELNISNRRISKNLLKHNGICIINGYKFENI